MRSAYEDTAGRILLEDFFKECFSFEDSGTRRILPDVNPRTRYTAFSGMLLVACYLAIYAVFSAEGGYLSRVYGPHLGPDGNVVLAPKRAFEKWEPFPLYDDAGRETIRTWIFFPLIWLDREFVHTRP